MHLLRRCVIQLVITKPLCPVRYYASYSIPHLSPMPERKPFQRLPSVVQPVNYALRIQPDLKALTFEGNEDVSVKVREKTNKIILNSVDLDISKASFKTSGSDAKHVAEVVTNAEDETLTLTFARPLEVGEGCLSLSFCGKLKDDMKGFYRSKYEVDGEERFAAVTQFEPTDARRAFPCWDEPALKATFDITLVVPKDRVALSNMPVASEGSLDTSPATKVVTYERTPIMSTYLLAMVIGEYDHIEARDTDGVLHRVYTPLGKKEQGRFALEVSVKTLPFYTTFFNIPYPLPKVDLIALADFSAGAMENWGLVTYRETALLFDPENSSQRNKLRVALVVGHELAHQWFGNLVTMEWWTHLWLNEGFASWIEYHCVDYCFPDYDVWTHFLSTDYAGALTDDALDNSHPIEVPVGHPSEIDEIFDSVSYSKGASIIRMLHHYVGDKDFRAGLSLYLKRHQHANTFTEDLWEALAEASGKSIADMMGSWTSQMGYPLITVSQTQSGNSRVLQLSQKKFCAGGERKEDTTQWKVPISVSSVNSNGKAVKTILLDKPSTEMTIDNIKPDEWIKVNPGCVDFYRVQYSREMLDDLVPALRKMILPPKDRLGLQNDLFALSMAGNVGADEVLTVVDAYANEDNYTVWSDVSTNLAALSNIVQYTDFYDRYSAFIVRLFTKINKKLGWDEKKDESPLDSMLRGTVLAKMGYHGHEATIAEAKRRFEAHCSGKQAMPSNIRAAVYLTVMAHGDEATFNKMVELHENSELQEETNRIEIALGAVKDDALIQKTLDFALSGKVRNQDIVRVLAGTTRTPQAREITWTFVQDHWDDLHGRFQGGFLISRLVKYATENFVTEKRATEIENFFVTNPAPSATRTIQQACENIRLNKDWLQRDEVCLRNYLA